MTILYEIALLLYSILQHSVQWSGSLFQAQCSPLLNPCCWECRVTLSLSLSAFKYGFLSSTNHTAKALEVRLSSQDSMASPGIESSSSHCMAHTVTWHTTVPSSGAVCSLSCWQYSGWSSSVTQGNIHLHFANTGSLGRIKPKFLGSQRKWTNPSFVSVNTPLKFK